MRKKERGGKSPLHAAIQLALKQKLGHEGVFLEHPFPEMGRIADLFWRPHNLVFEVQISPITPKEVAARNQDYRRLGLEVIWILHEKRFNRRVLTPAEVSLEGAPHYYTNLNTHGVGAIYTQTKLVWNGRVKKRSPRYPISIDRPMQKDSIIYFSGEAKPVRQALKARKRRNPYRILLDWLIESLA